MANYKLLIPFILQHEGGYANNPNDLGGATNKGITWTNFQAYAGRLGYSGDWNTFLQMPQSIWERVYKAMYWDAVWGDRIQNQAVADVLADFAWGSGPGTAVRVLQQTLNSLGRRVTVDGGMGQQTLAAVNGTNSKRLFEALSDARDNFLEAIIRNNPSQAVFRAGWFRRTRELYEARKKLLAAD